ncbi:hypothetical protein BX600DRAFT_473552 [Xylariales sp. PMI_506]|nr:hypothetical protein BX600DRAFT_473552 [Xylariales sp. PMI_506]
MDRLTSAYTHSSPAEPPPVGSDVHNSRGLAPLGRRIRRGTSSCWECKRRKIRCHFETNTTDVCGPCRVRGARCVRQHLPDDGSGEVTGLCRRNGLAPEAYRPKTLPMPVIVTAVTPGDEQSISSVICESSEDVNSKHTESTNSTSAPSTVQPTQNVVKGAMSDASSVLNSDSKPKMPSRKAAKSRQKISNRALVAKWQAPVARTRLIGGVLPGTHPLSVLLSNMMPLPGAINQIVDHSKAHILAMELLRGHLKEFYQRSSAGHSGGYCLGESLSPNQEPMFLARKLIQFATCLMSLDASTSAAELRIDGSIKEVADRYFDAASRHVTSLESLVTSAEGLETIMFESIYHLGNGHYQQAWLASRRAMSIALLLGLHIPHRRRQMDQQRPARPSHESISCESLWFRLNHIDCYCSLILNLPLFVANGGLTNQEMLVEVEPLDEIDRTHILISSRIITRNERLGSSNQHSATLCDHYLETRNIDNELKKMMRLLSTKWWALPRANFQLKDGELKAHVARRVVQVHHYELVLFAHLPYIILQPESTAVTGSNPLPDYTYNKISAVTASREIHARIRNTKSLGMVRKLMIVALTLLLVHLDSDKLGDRNMLAHQRPNDLQIIDEVIENLESLATATNDHSVSAIIHALKRVGDFEESAAGGHRYRVWSEVLEPTESVDCIIHESECSLDLFLPYYGNLHIELVEETQSALVGNGSYNIRSGADIGQYAIPLLAGHDELTQEALNQASSEAVEDLSYLLQMDTFSSAVERNNLNSDFHNTVTIEAGFETETTAPQSMSSFLMTDFQGPWEDSTLSELF